MEILLVWGLGLIALAFLLLVVDLFLPTMGVLIITAAIIAIAGVVCLFRHDTVWGIIGTLVCVVGGPTAFFMGMQVMPNTPIGRKLIPPEPLDLQQGRERLEDAMSKMLGQEGVVVSDLRPIGMVKIGDQRFDALAETSMIRAGTKVKVVGTDGNELRVRPV